MAFAVDASADPKQEVKSMKAVCEMFSKIPQDIVGNTSITKVAQGLDRRQASAAATHADHGVAIGRAGRPKISSRSSARR